MSYTQTQIDALKAAIASGTLTVRHGETSVTYQSLEAMLKALAIMEAEVAGTTARPRRTVAAYGNGC